MSGWERDDILWDCDGCGGVIPAGEPFFNAEPTGRRTHSICLSCILTASASLLPGQPKSIRVEWLGSHDPEIGSWTIGRQVFDTVKPGGSEYRLTVDGVEYGVMTVDAGIAEDQQVPALLALVRQALKWRAEGKLKPRTTEANPILDELSFVPAESGPYRYQPRYQPKPLLRCVEIPLAPNMESITSEVPVIHGRPDLKITATVTGVPLPFTVGHPVTRPSDACPCLRPIFGRWHDIPSDRLAPYGLNKKWSALKGCKTCAGTGRVPPPSSSPFAPDYSWIGKRIGAGLPIFIKHDPEVVVQGAHFSGQGVIGPQVKRAADEIRSHYLAWLRQQIRQYGAKVSRNLFHAFKAGRESIPRTVGRGEPETAPVCQGGAWDNPTACLMHEGLPIGPDGLCIEGRKGRSAPR